MKSRPIRHLHVRRRGLIVSMIVTFAVVAATAATAGAGVVNQLGPHTVYAWGDCSVDVGNVKTTTGAAVGGADITCGHYRGVITAKVNLYRYTATTGWQLARTSPWYATYNNYALSLSTTPPYCGNGLARWYTMVTVNVDGYQTQFTSSSALYTPPAC
jgi:hypothetical protein